MSHATCLEHHDCSMQPLMARRAVVGHHMNIKACNATGHTSLQFLREACLIMCMSERALQEVYEPGCYVDRRACRPVASCSLEVSDRGPMQGVHVPLPHVIHQHPSLPLSAHAEHASSLPGHTIPTTHVFIQCIDINQFEIL